MCEDTPHPGPPPAWGRSWWGGRSWDGPLNGPVRPRRAGWLVEGVADHVRFFRYEPGTRLTLADPCKASDRDGHRTSAMSLARVGRANDRRAVAGLFHETTGKALSNSGTSSFVLSCRGKVRRGSERSVENVQIMTRHG